MPFRNDMKFIYMTYAAEEISKLNIIRPKHGFLVKVRFRRATAILCMIVNTQQRTDKYQERYQGCIWTMGGGGGWWACDENRILYSLCV